MKGGLLKYTYIYIYTCREKSFGSREPEQIISVCYTLVYVLKLPIIAFYMPQRYFYFVYLLNLQKKVSFIFKLCILAFHNFSLLSQNFSLLRKNFSLVYFSRQNFSLLKVLKRTRFSRIGFSHGIL